MSAPDVHAITARRVHGLPKEWLPCVYECLDRDLGFALTGAIPIGAYSRGPRKGRPKWPPKRDMQRVVITMDEVRETQIQWERENGLCCRCGGSGQTLKSTGVRDGVVFRAYRTCIGCEGSGKALHVRQEEAVRARLQQWPTEQL